MEDELARGDRELARARLSTALWRLPAERLSARLRVFLLGRAIAVEVNKSDVRTHNDAKAQTDLKVYCMELISRVLTNYLIG